MDDGRARRLVTESVLSGRVDQSPGSKKSGKTSSHFVHVVDRFTSHALPSLSAEEGVRKELVVRRC